MGSLQLKNWLDFPSVIQVYGTVLARSHETLGIDGSDTVNRVVMTLEDDFGFFFCFPGNHLVIAPGGQKIVFVETINIKNLPIVLVERLHESPLTHIPLL